MSQAEIIRQAARVSLYRSDFPRFAQEQLKIVTKRSSLEPFALYPFQRRLAEKVRAQQQRAGYVRQVWLKSRQLGHSTLAQGLMFHRAVLWPNVNAVVVAHDDGTAQQIFQKAHAFYDNLDLWLRPMKRYSTRQELFFANPSERDRDSVPGLKSRIVVASARNIHSSAGGTYHSVHLSEAARYPKPEEIETSTLQTVALAPGTLIIIESTARPEGHWFKAMCDAARSGDSIYEFDFIGWPEDPTCRVPLAPGEVIEPESLDEEALTREFALEPEQLKWHRMKLADMRGDVDAFRQEYPTTAEEAWVLRDYTVFPMTHLRRLASGLEPPRFRATPVIANANTVIARDIDGPLSVWEEPVAGAAYDLGVDVAQGSDTGGADWSTIEVLKRPYAVQVAEYRAKTDPGELAHVVAGVGRYYNWGQVAVEVRGPGYYTNDILANVMAYPNLYIWRKKDTIKQRLSNYFGFDTTLQAKHRHLVPLAKDRVYRHVTGGSQSGEPLVRSHALWKEMSIFVQGMGTDQYHAAPGKDNHDDLVMAWMLAVLAGHDEYGLDMGAAPVPEPILAYGGPAYSMTPEEASMPDTRRHGLWGDTDGWRVA